MTISKRLKPSYTIQEAASRLALSCGESIGERDIFQLVLLGELPLAVHFFQQHAQETAPVTLLWNWWPEKSDDPTRLPDSPFARKDQSGPNVELTWQRTPFHRETIKRQSDEQRVLSGEYYFWLQGPRIAHYLNWLVGGNDPSDYDECVVLDGYCVTAADGTIYEPVERDEADNEWIPVFAMPTVDNLRIRASDLDALEARHNRARELQPEGLGLSGKERAHLLKVIAALLSKSKISKSEAVTTVLAILEAEGQSSINRETLAKTLKSANALRS